MSSAYRYGDWNGAFGGETVSEIVQGRTDAREDEIRRPERRIDVMSEEEWQRRTAQAARQRQAWHERLAARQARRAASLSDDEKAQPLLDRYVAEVNLQRQYQKQLPKKLRDYHEAPEGTMVARDDWEDAYQDIGHFLAAALLAYHYQVDNDNRSVMGPDLSSCRDHTLQLDIPKAPSLECYFEHRGISATDDELRYFDGCIAKKADFPVFLVAALEDNLKRLSKYDDASLAAHKQLLIYTLEEDLIRQEITDILLLSMTK